MKATLSRGRLWLLGIVTALALAALSGYVFWWRLRVPDAVVPQVEAIVAALRPRLGQARTAELLKSCAERSCACVEAAAAAGLEVAPKSVLGLLDAAGKRCDNVRAQAMHLEAEARVGRWREMRVAAEGLRQREPNNGFAHQALAYSYFVEGDMARTLQLAEQAEKHGRGSAAAMLLGLAAFRQGELGSAAQSFSRALKLEPSDTDALYNYALAMQRNGRFLEPREAYLQLLRQRPDYAEARYNLCVLLHGVGAQAEAEHHFRKLEQAKPGSADVVRLRELLAQPPARGAIPLSLAPAAP